MSMMSFAERGDKLLAAWESQGEVRMGEIEGEKLGKVVTPASGEAGRKYPSVSIDESGAILLAWAEGTAFRRGGALAYQLFNAGGEPMGPVERIDGGIPVFGLPATAPLPGGGFLLLH